MKIRCSCGAKYEFDITPEMAQNPIRFVCSNCGLNSSDYVNPLVRAEIAEQFPNATLPPQPAPNAPRLKISHEEKPAEQPAGTETGSRYCPKHPGEPATEKCVVCHKPICPKCMEIFGYFCSPFCKNKAAAQNIVAPVFARQKFEVEAQFWRKMGLIFFSSAAAIVLALGFWTWYAWFGSVPHTYFSVRFGNDDRAYAGDLRLVSKNQIIFLHGGALARYDLKTKKPVWSLELVTQDQIAVIVKQEGDLLARENQSSEFRRVPLPGSQEREAKIALQNSLSLQVFGRNIWVSQPGKLVHYDWDSGKILQEVALPESGGELVERAGELQIPGSRSVTHINLATGETHTENFGEAGRPVASTQTASGGVGNNFAASGLTLAGADKGKPLDPNQVAAQAQNLKTPGRIALPALLANAAYEQQLEAALRDDPPHPRGQNTSPLQAEAGGFKLVADQDGFVQFSTRLLEEHIVTRAAMKAPPKKSALDNANLNASQTADVANDILNEIQRNRGGDTVSENESRYQVTVHLPDSPGAADWTGDVIGPPQLFALKTVNVIAAGKTVIVLDKSNKKLWQAALTYSVSAGDSEFAGRGSQFGEGPCVEHGDTLYVFDQAVLSAFDISHGNVHWRLPSIGIVGLFFDDQGMMYINTTTGNPDDIKYSRQIDITKSTSAILLKINPKTGKILWSTKPGGFISYLSGKFIYTVESYDPNPTDEEELSDTLSGFQKPPYLRIARIRPVDGGIQWEHSQDRCPVSVQFSNNLIALVFKKEVQVLKYLSF